MPARHRSSTAAAVATAAAIWLIALAGASAQTAAAPPDEFADSVVSSSGLGSTAVYADPSAALGQPTTLVDGVYDDPPGTYHASMVYPPYNTDPSGNDLLVTLGTQGTETVAFSTPITHDADHWYGDDFIVYGSSFFGSSDAITPTTDMATDTITGSDIYQSGTPTVSVSSDGVTFYTLTPTTPWYPTNPYQWAGVSAQNPSGWNDAPGALNSFSKPVSPGVSLDEFAGTSVAGADADLYDGSAGGAAFSLAGLTGAGGQPITSISYIRFTGAGGSSAIDAVSRVGDAASAAPAPESGTAALAAALALLLGAPALAAAQRREAPAAR